MWRRSPRWRIASFGASSATFRPGPTPMAMPDDIPRRICVAENAFRSSRQNACPSGTAQKEAQTSRLACSPTFA